MNRWTRYAARNTLGAVGLLFLVWTLLLSPVDPVRQRMEANELAFIVLGLLQVLAGVMVLTSLAPQFVGWLAKQRAVLKRTGPVGSVALAHPLAHPLRTAVVMGMFSITMFSVVVLAGYTEQFDTYSSDFVEEAEGDFELLLTSTRSRPIDGRRSNVMGINTLRWEHRRGWRRIGHRFISKTAKGANAPPLRGLIGFIEHGGLPLHAGLHRHSSEEAGFSVFENIVFLTPRSVWNRRQTAPRSCRCNFQLEIHFQLIFKSETNEQPWLEASSNSPLTSSLLGCG